MPDLAAALVGHLVGDYLLQDDWMAKEKRTRTAVAALHAALWTTAVLVCTGWCTWPAALFLFTTHCLQDRTGFARWWMTACTNQRDFATGPLSPWSISVVDNTWHAVALWVTARFLLPA
jgi:hypothetical protein